MGTSQEHCVLGMDRRIDRRDFLNGVAIGIGGAYAASKGAPARAAQQSGARPADYPPSRGSAGQLSGCG
jgi:spermidine dehydrogenase